MIKENNECTAGVTQNRNFHTSDGNTRINTDSIPWTVCLTHDSDILQDRIMGS